MLHTLKVLIQWLPSSTLRIERSLTLGPKWATEVQQDDVTVFSPNFPLALAIAEQPADGRFIIQVGFKGAVRHNEIGWILDGAPISQSVHYFDEMPTDDEAKIEHLLRVAKRLSPVKGPELNARIKRFEKMRKDQLRASAEAGKKAAEEALAMSPMHNMEAFDRVAGWAIRYEDGTQETLGPADGRVAVEAMKKAVAENAEAVVDAPVEGVIGDVGTGATVDVVTGG